MTWTVRDIGVLSIGAVIAALVVLGPSWLGAQVPSGRIGGAMSVLEGVQREIEGMPARLQTLGVASLALAMAGNIDARRGSPSEQGKVLLEALKELRALAPPKKEKDVVDQLADQRKRRRAAARSAET